MYTTVPLLMGFVISLYFLFKGFFYSFKPSEYNDQSIIKYSHRFPFKYVQENHISKREWEYVFHIYGRSYIWMGVINCFLLVLEIKIFNYIYSFNSSITNILAFACLFPTLLLMLITRKIVKEKVSKYDPYDLLSEFRKVYEKDLGHNTINLNTLIDQAKDNLKQIGKLAIDPLDTKIEELDKSISIMQEELDQSDIQVKYIKETSMSENMIYIEDDLNQYDKYHKIIQQYKNAVHYLKLASNLCESLPFYIIAYDVAYYEYKIGNSEEALSGNYINSDLRKVKSLTVLEGNKQDAIDKKDEMFKAYDDYKKQIEFLSQLCKEYALDLTTASYFIQDAKLLRTTYNDILLSRDDVVVIARLLKEIEIQVLNDLLVYYKKINNLFLDFNQTHDITIDEDKYQEIAKQVQKEKNKESIQNIHDQLSYTIEELKEAIQLQQDTLDHNNHEIIKLKQQDPYFWDSKMDLYYKKERNRKIIYQYKLANSKLSDATQICDKLPVIFKEYEQNKTNVRVYISSRPIHSHHSRSNSSLNLSHELALQDAKSGKQKSQDILSSNIEEIYDLYNQYIDIMSELDQLFNEYFIDLDVTKYLVNNDKISMIAEHSIDQFKKDVPVLDNLMKEEKALILTDLLDFLKKQNDNYEVVFHQ